MFEGVKLPLNYGDIFLNIDIEIYTVIGCKLAFVGMNPSPNIRNLFKNISVLGKKYSGNSKVNLWGCFVCVELVDGDSRA